MPKPLPVAAPLACTLLFLTGLQGEALATWGNCFPTETQGQWTERVHPGLCANIHGADGATNLTET